MVTATLEVPVGPSLTEQQAREIFSQGEEAVIFALLAMAKQLAEQTATAAGDSHQTPATPSGMKPAYKKPNASRRKKKPGRKAGHVGSRRPSPEEIDHCKKHRANRCPDCNSPLKRQSFEAVSAVTFLRPFVSFVGGFYKSTHYLLELSSFFAFAFSAHRMDS